MQNNFSLSSPKPKVRHIITLDGQKITVPLFENSTITNHDNLKLTLHLSIFNDSNPLHIALSNLIIDMLTTMSILYVAAITRSVKKWFVSNISQQKSLDISCLESLNNVNPNYLHFLIPLLRKLSRSHKNLMTADLNDFLNNNRWEEKNPIYFKLVVNDPEKGAFTTQELDNLHENLNFAFSKKKMNIFDYTLAWFFISTGARPVQLSRLKFNDIDIIQNDVMIKMPLAKGVGIINQGYFLRKARRIQT